MKTYCVTCKVKTETVNPINKISKNSKNMVLGDCEVCNRKKKEVRNKLEQIYYNPETGFCGINELVRRSGYSQSVVKEFLDSLDTYTKHKPAKHNYQRNRVIVKGIDDQFQADLVEMIPYEKKINIDIF
ncbi:hypothetical protein B4U80_10033 [Leptotrombidium deliense]|uniref:DUF5679 domain-containing protein n=1 Tax=Leptotrombidium deliense TaxID=299467 RepID=A0A443RS09_9ACAR|nr:hypothetical protein B4U80_10033 [Leptotrombidium deliense]